MDFCANCGTKLDEGVKFCSGCATPDASAGVEIKQEKTVNIIQAQPSRTCANMGDYERCALADVVVGRGAGAYRYHSIRALSWRGA
jgi:uncharacterized membrane protein YvbJ